jgi:hypothetical protein
MREFRKILPDEGKYGLRMGLETIPRRREDY